MSTTSPDALAFPVEEILATARANAKVDPAMAIWGWEIPVYLFLGGLAAGIMCFAAAVVLLGREREAPFAAHRLALWAPVVLSAGMGALFLDLEHKLHVYRFYTTFQPASPMSWGSWVLVLVYPASLALVLATLREGYPRLAAALGRWPLGARAMDAAEGARGPIGIANVVLGCLLGIYTGVLLGSLAARPFWNTGLLGPLFLISGLSTAAALALLAARERSERHLFTRLDAGLIAIEVVLVGLLVASLVTAARPQREAAELVLGGPHTLVFWAGFVGLGLLVPIAIELAELARPRRLAVVAPLLVLAGGYLLRHLMVELGQVSRWTEYAHQYDPRWLLGMQ